MAAGRNGPVAIGVSGGSDSLGLLHLADVWARRAGRELVILSVDHGLRPAAADEVRGVCARATALGYRTRTLKGTPASPSQSDARHLRHGLLAEAARVEGASLLLLGHTRTDVEETFLMRLGRGSGLATSAAPQPLSVSPVWPGGRELQIGRPLLGQRREDIQAWLSERGIDWISDPSNSSPRYERVRMRALIAQLGPVGCLADIVRDAALLRAAGDRQLAKELRDLVQTDPHGQIELLGRSGNLRASAALLGRLVQVASGGDRPVDRQKLLAAAAKLDTAPRGHRLTLGGAWLQKGGQGLLIGRDPGAVDATWRRDIWDGRYKRARGGTPVSDAPYLVRHGLPGRSDWREVVSERIRALADTLMANAVLAGDIFGPDA